MNNNLSNFFPNKVYKRYSLDGNYCSYYDEYDNEIFREWSNGDKEWYNGNEIIHIKTSSGLEWYADADDDINDLHKSYSFFYGDVWFDDFGFLVYTRLHEDVNEIIDDKYNCFAFISDEYETVEDVFWRGEFGYARRTIDEDSLNYDDDDENNNEYEDNDEEKDDKDYDDEKDDENYNSFNYYSDYSYYSDHYFKSPDNLEAVDLWDETKTKEKTPPTTEHIDYEVLPNGDKTWHDINGRIIRIKHPDNSEVAYSYDNEGNQSYQKDIESQGNVTYEKSAFGDEIWYNSAGKIIHKKDSYGDEEWHEYNANGRRIYDKYSSGVECWYNDKGELLHKINSDGTEEFYKYNFWGRIVYQKDINGVESWFDDNGKLVRKKYINGKISDYVNTLSSVASEQNAVITDDIIGTWEYEKKQDEFEKFITAKNPHKEENKSKQYIDEYSKETWLYENDLLKHQEGADSIVEKTNKTIEQDLSTSNINNTKNILKEPIIIEALDKNEDKRKHIIDTDGTETWYINGGRLVKKIDFFNNDEWHFYNKDGLNVHDKYSDGKEFWYNDKGELIHKKNEDGSETFYEYNNEGKRIKQRDINKKGKIINEKLILGDEKAITKNTFAKPKQKIKKNNKKIFIPIACLLIVLFGVFITWTNIRSNGHIKLPFGDERWYEDWKLIHTKKSDGTESWYNDEGIIIHTKHSDGIERWFDNHGILTHMSNPDGSKSWFDANGRKEHEISIDGIEYWYDNQGNAIHMKNPDSTEVWYYPDGKVEHEIKVTGEENWYDINSKVIHKKQKNGSESFYTYNNKGKITSRKDIDAKGNLRYEKQSSGNEVWYNTKGRVVHKKDTAGNEEWYEYNASRVKVHKKYSNGEEQWFENGNLIHKKLPDNYEEWYDIKGRVIRKNLYDSFEQIFDYDSNGKLICESWKNIKGILIHQKWSDGKEYWYNEKGDVINKKP